MFHYEMYLSFARQYKVAPSFNLIRAFDVAMQDRPGGWTVIGITKPCLMLFESIKFKKPTNKGIQRAHLTSRNEFIKHIFMLETPLTLEELDRYWEANHVTVLCAPGENKNPGPEHYIAFDRPDLFKPRSIGWTHAKAEEEFLKNLAKAYLQT